MIRLEDLLHYRDKLLPDCESLSDYIGWEFPSGRVLMVYPWVTIFDSIEDMRVIVPPGYNLKLQTITTFAGIDYEPKQYLQPKRPWWKFW